MQKSLQLEAEYMLLASRAQPEKDETKWLNVCLESRTLVGLRGFSSGALRRRLFCWIMHAENGGQKEGKMLFQTLFLHLQAHDVHSFWSDPPPASRWISSHTTECHLRGFSSLSLFF